MKMLHAARISAQRGLTLIELLTTVSVIAIVLSVGVPSFNSIVANNQITTTTNTFVAIMNVARSEAMKRSQTIKVLPDADDATHRRILVTVNSTGEVIQQIPLPADMEITANIDDVSFLRTGFIDKAEPPTIQVCDSTRNGETGRILTISLSGRLNITETTCS